MPFNSPNLKYISANDCFNVEIKIKTVLNGLGFADRYNQIIDTMSGGEKVLARTKFLST